MSTQSFSQVPTGRAPVGKDPAFQAFGKLRTLLLGALALARLAGMFRSSGSDAGRPEPVA